VAEPPAPLSEVGSLWFIAVVDRVTYRALFGNLKG
jgi:hypothetical protein